MPLQSSTASLFKLLQNKLSNRLPTVRCTQATLAHLAHSLEDLILSQQTPALVLTSFQRPDYWHQEAAAYQGLTDRTQQLYVFTLVPPVEPHPVPFYVPLNGLASLYQEGFLLILSEPFSIVLCGQAKPVASAEGLTQQFETFWSFEPAAINPALDVLIELIATYHPEKLAQLQTARTHCKLRNPDPALITQFTMELFHYEEKQHQTLQPAVAPLSQRELPTSQAEVISELAGQKRVLEMIARGIPMADTLNEITKLIEQQAPEMLCSILLLDKSGTKLHLGAAPSLPESFNQAVDGEAIGPSAGSCGTAAFRGEPVIVSDIATDPLWANYRDLALKYNLRACWSTPIFSSKGQVLGTFAMYYREPRHPTAHDLQLIEVATHLASIAIERKQIEETLHESESQATQAQAQLMDAIESLTEAFALYDAEDRLVLCNSKYREFYDLSADLLVPGVRFEDYIRASAYRGQAAEAIGREEEWIRERIAHHQNPQGVHFQQLSNGRWLQINERKTKEGGIVGVRTDITERKQVEEALRESEERFKAFMDHSPVVAFIKDEAGRYIYGNRVWVDQFEEPAATLLGKTDFDLWPAATAEQFRVSDLAALSVGTNSESIELRTITEKVVRYWTILKFLIKDASGRRMVGGMAFDITKRKQAEAALQESEERFRATFEQAAVGLVHVGLDHRWLRVNQKLCDILGYSREELLTKTSDDLTYPEDLNLDQEHTRQMLQGEIQTHSEEKRYIRLDGSPIWINQTRSFVRDTAGKPKYFIIVIEDITERKRLEEQLRQSQKLEAIGRLAGGVAHDFNNLLTVINGYSDLLLQHYTESDPPRRDIEQIRKAGERAASLTRQLLAFSRQQVLQPRVLDLNTVVTDMEKMLRRLIGEHIELVTRPQPGLGQIKADLGQIEQIIMNLAVNARDAMPQGGRLILETANIFLDQAHTRQDVAAMQGPYVLLAVSDTGSGMDAATVSHIFEPFFTTKEVGKGTGLGLATVYGIVGQSGGHIRVYSEVGWGTTFKIYFPQLKETSSLLALAETPIEAFQGIETILLVEDEASVRTFIGNLLKDSGYTVLEAGDGREALAVSQKHPAPIHLLLTDVLMPGMSGPELANHLMVLRSELKVLYMSGYTADANIHQSILNLGAAFLSKPFTPDVLAHKIREVLAM